MEMKKLWLFIGVSFIAGFIWGGVIKEISLASILVRNIISGHFSHTEIFLVSD
jgi:hypothetical protein